MLNELRRKSKEWEETNFAHYVVESLAEEQKGFVRHPQKQPIINDSTLCLFLMISSLQYGGNWYHWYELNRKNNRSIKVLLECLTISYQRVQFRILFVLQFFPENEIIKHVNRLDTILSKDIIRKIRKYVLEKNVFLLFNELEKNTDEALKNKVKSVIREINQYWPEEELKKIIIEKTYNVFISFSKFDIKIAETIASSINNYFRGAIKVFYAPKDIKVGSKWKETLLNALKEYDAVISLISQDTYKKPWIIAEFTAFWLQSKDIYILKYGDLDYNQVFQIFSDYQICNIQKKQDIIDLIDVLATKTETQFVPFDKAQAILDQINQSIDETVKIAHI